MRRMLQAGLVVVSLVPAACALYVEPAPPLDDVGDDDAPTGTCDPDLYPACAEACSYECGWPVECAVGRSAVWDPTPVPCWEWTDTCAPIGWIECADGCDVDGSYWEVPSGFIDQRRVCAEYPTARAGDPCENAFDCRPTRLELQADGSLRQDYLSCGLDVCEVINDPPPLDGYLGACAPEVRIDPGASGVAQGCLFVDVPGDCLYTGWSPRCDGDWECPQGSSCDSSLPSFGADTEARCRPGLRGTPLLVGALSPTICAGG